MNNNNKNKLKKRKNQSCADFHDESITFLQRNISQNTRKLYEMHEIILVWGVQNRTGVYGHLSLGVVVLKRAVLKFGKNARINIVTINNSALSWLVRGPVWAGSAEFDSQLVRLLPFPCISKCRVALLVSVTEHWWREERVKWAQYRRPQVLFWIFNTENLPRELVRHTH